ncbi:lipopolysaccharide biosynthesis protein [Reichenbachiella versicolor]|uniref:lipopolysaccharide biosynthesis protein n=1 Tax=Reichenbachiella versicolor TaxID=1821036 RepID=UPI000D6EAAB8|nr:polysaccharide biosynthesis C-terminal domain-containing protein [Reichenbachiella versicolor]
MKKQGLLSMIIVYIGIGLGYLNMIILMPKYFTIEEIGLRNYLIDFATIFFQLSLFGFSSATIKYFSPFKEVNEKGYLAFIFSIPILNFIFLSSILLIGKGFLFSFYNNSPLFIEYFYLIFPLTFALLSITLFESYLRNYYKVLVPTFFREFSSRLLFLALIIVVGIYSWDRSLFWWLFTGIYLIQCIALILYIIFLKKLNLRLDFKVFKSDLIKGILNYSTFAVLNGTVTMLFLKFDVIMLGAQLSLREVGIYTTMIYIATVAEIPKRILMQFASPQIAAAWHENNSHKIDQIYKQYSLIQLILSSTILLALYYGMDSMFTILPKKEFSEGALALIILLFTKVIISGFGPVNEIISFSSKYKINLILSTITSVVAIVLNYYFIQYWGINGAAIATLLVIGLSQIFKLFYIKYNFGFFQFTYNSLGVVALIAILFIVKPLVFNLENIYLDLILKSSGVSIVFIASLFSFKLLQRKHFDFKERR